MGIDPPLKQRRWRYYKLSMNRGRGGLAIWSTVCVRVSVRVSVRSPLSECELSCRSAGLKLFEVRNEVGAQTNVSASVAAHIIVIRS